MAQPSFAAEASVHWSDQPRRDRSAVQGQLISTRDNLVNIQSALRRALDRVRGPSVEAASGSKGANMPDPDHIVFLGEQTVELSADCDRLLNQLADYI